jgi:hypothetical protein
MHVRTRWANVLTFVRQCGSLSDPSSTPVTRNQEGKKRPFRGLVKASSVCDYAAEEKLWTKDGAKTFKDQHLVSSLLIKKHSTDDEPDYSSNRITRLEEFSRLLEADQRKVPCATHDSELIRTKRQGRGWSLRQCCRW